MDRIAVALLIGFFIDCFLGDPHRLPHPVVLIGKLISGLERVFRRLLPKTVAGERTAGGLIWLVTAAVSGLVPWGILRVCGLVSPWLALGVQGIMCWQNIAPRSLRDESMKVYRALKTGTLPQARQAVSMIVGRDTEQLDAAAVARAAVETVAENASDGVIAPLLFIALGGAPLGFVYKAVNTMDSMLGYVEPPYKNVGCIPAHMDDIFNFIPARLCAVLMLVGFLCTDSLLRLIQTPEEILEDSKLYLNIYILGLPFVFYYNVATGIFSALGDSRTPFIFLACSSLSNIGADILFVTAFGMKVDGVAWATFLCQGVSCVLAIIFVLRRFRRFETPEKAPVFSWRLLGRIATVAIPSILQQSFISVGNIVIQSVINGFGTATIAGYSASVKLNNLVITSLTTLGNGVSNFTAQNLGAGKYDRIRAGFRAGVRLVWCVCAPLVALYLLAGRQLVYVFMDSPTGEAMDVGVIFLRILSPFYFVVSAKIIADSVLRGAGRMKGFVIATFTDLILRVALAEVLSRTPLGSTGIWLAWPIGWCIATVLSLTFCLTTHFDDRQVREIANVET